MYQEYQKADDNITFTHILNVKDKAPEDYLPWRFSTCYESTLVEWDLHIKQRFDTPDWNVRLMGFGRCGIYPPVVRIEFKVNESDSNGNTINSLRYKFKEAEIQRSNEGGSMFFWTEDKCQFEKVLGLMMKDAENNESVKVQLETLMEFKIDGFIDVKYTVDRGAPLLENQSAFYLKSLTNGDLHDFKLKTSDGSQILKTSKEVLWISSPYFRQILQEDTNEHTVQGASSLECIDICLTYLVTEMYKKPALMTPRLASEILGVIPQWVQVPSYPLKHSVSNHCYEELRKNHDDLEYVVNLLIVAQNVDLYSVKGSCIATIVSHHFKDYLNTFFYGNHPLRGRLNTNNHGTGSLTNEIKAAFVSSNRVRSFIKFIPEHGED